jgi:hypothetical protein
MPNGLNLGFFAVELAFGMNTLLMGSGRYVSSLSASASSPSHRCTPYASTSSKSQTVHARCALVGAALGPGMGQDVLSADLVVQRVEAVAGFGLRFRV